jgi:primosomal replication protein N''
MSSLNGLSSSFWRICGSLSSFLASTKSRSRISASNCRLLRPSSLSVANAPTSARSNPLPPSSAALGSQGNAHYRALYAASPRLGLSYRDVLTLLAAQEAESDGLAAPYLREGLGPLDIPELEAVVTECTGLVEVWLDGRVDGSALAAFRIFAVDAALGRQLAAAVATWSNADEARISALRAGATIEGGPPIGVTDVSLTRAWLGLHAAALSDVPAYVLKQAGIWRSLFSGDGSRRRQGKAQRMALSALIDRVERLANERHAALPLEIAAKLDEAALVKARRARGLFAPEPSLWEQLNPLRPLRRAAARKLLRQVNLPENDDTARAFADVAAFEMNVRESAAQLRSILEAFELKVELDLSAISKIRTSARALSGVLDEMDQLARRLDDCPADAEAWMAAEVGTQAALNGFIKRLCAGLLILEACLAALAALEVLAPWLEENFAKARRKEIAANAPAQIAFAAPPDCEREASIGG